LTAEQSREYRDAINARRLAVVERWTGQKWIEVRLRWNGTEYKENN
jgi:hypothetical protein